MTIQANIVVPSVIDTSNPCCCTDTVIKLERYPLIVTTTAGGISGNSLIKIRDIDYQTAINISFGGDSLSGSVKFTKIRHNKITDNVLAPQRTAFPTVPFSHEWTGLRLYGIGDFVTLEVKDTGSVGPVTGGQNTRVTGEFKAELVQISTNTIITTVKQAYNFAGSDTLGWTDTVGTVLQLPINIPGSDLITYTIGLRKSNLVAKPGTIQVSGTVKMTKSAAGSSSSGFTSDFNSLPTISDYNSKFPWINSWTVLDTKEPLLALLPYDATFLAVPADYRIILTLTASGA